jgi:hypothetical protein
VFGNIKSIKTTISLIKSEKLIVQVFIPLTEFTLPHSCTRPKPGPGFPMYYVMVFSIHDERLEAFVLLILVEWLTGQNYVFDVQRTWREVYDSTRRKLMKEANTNLCREEEAMEDGSESNIVPKNHE